MTTEIREQIACKLCPRNCDCDSPPTLNGIPKHARCAQQLKEVDTLIQPLIEQARKEGKKEVTEYLDSLGHVVGIDIKDPKKTAYLFTVPTEKWQALTGQPNPAPIGRCR